MNVHEYLPLPHHHLLFLCFLLHTGRYLSSWIQEVPQATADISTLVCWCCLIHRYANHCQYWHEITDNVFIITCIHVYLHVLADVDDEKWSFYLMWVYSWAHCTKSFIHLHVTRGEDTVWEAGTFESPTPTSKEIYRYVALWVCWTVLKWNHFHWQPDAEHTYVYVPWCWSPLAPSSCTCTCTCMYMC